MRLQDRAQLSAVVLCGGEGRRLGGADKPLQRLAGQPLVARVLARVRPQVSDVLISANRNVECYAAYGHPVAADGSFAGLGPLAGIVAGFDRTGGDWLLCVPGDAPLLPLDLVDRLAAACRIAAADAAYVHDGAGPQPLCTLLSRRCAASLDAFVAQGGDAPRIWLESLPAARADHADWPRWAWSVNTPTQWLEAERLLGQCASMWDEGPKPSVYD
jgi:molybdopterin-guanine dinucleotide biosynthesis protein A